ncbi:MAG TPA: hypothetical protein VJT49_32265 [Amycolatopsis sp.]|uniref:hypothetical protein n=1 Tax=Amycolatopsis sp. TaxID=37632 RepID=UPI002B482D00|nr:hypothetical protein [Amycolatopsis sp.]HKS49698.1 hypothetical protein [Amycolatopsis sp.]
MPAHFCLRSGRQALNDKGTVSDWMHTWIAQKRHQWKNGRLAYSTLYGYEKDKRLYIDPKIGHIRLDRLNLDDLIEMFNRIQDDNDRIEANNADRATNRARAKEIHNKPTGRKKAEWMRLEAELAAMPPYRRPVGPSSQHSILRTLRASLNRALKTPGKLKFNPPPTTTWRR